MQNFPQNNNKFMQMYNAMFDSNGLKPEAVNYINNAVQNIQAQGNAQQMVQQLMNNRQMSQGMYNMLRGFAHNIMRFLPR